MIYHVFCQNAQVLLVGVLDQELLARLQVQDHVVADVLLEFKVGVFASSVDLMLDRRRSRYLLVYHTEVVLGR